MMMVVVVLVALVMTTSGAAKLMYGFVFRLAPMTGRLLKRRCWWCMWLGGLDGLKQLVVAIAAVAITVARVVAAFAVRRPSIVIGITATNTDGDGVAIALGAELFIAHPAEVSPEPVADECDKSGLGFGVGERGDVDLSAVRRCNLCRLDRRGPSRSPRLKVKVRVGIGCSKIAHG